MVLVHLIARLAKVFMAYRWRPKDVHVYLMGITSNTSCTLPMLTSGPVSGVGGGCCRGCECWCRWPRCRERLSVLPSVASLVLPPTAAQRTAVPLMSLTHKAAPLEEACTTDGNVVVPDRASMWPWWRS